MNRNARASIISSSLSIECYANALISSLEISKDCLNDLDKLPPISKIEMFFRVSGIEKNINHGDHRIQKTKELITIRNAYVHTKKKIIKTTIGLPEDKDTHWTLPLELDGDLYKSLKIPKSSMFWNDQNALLVLEASLDFYNYLSSFLDKTEEDKEYLLVNRVIFGNFIMPSNFFEFEKEINLADELGLNVEFIKKNNKLIMMLNTVINI